MSRAMVTTGSVFFGMLYVMGDLPLNHTKSDAHAVIPIEQHSTNNDASLFIFFNKAVLVYSLFACKGMNNYVNVQEF